MSKQGLKIFEYKDLILSKLNLPDPCPIKIEIKGDFIYLFVGQRDWQWKFSDGKFVGCGTSWCK